MPRVETKIQPIRHNTNFKVITLKHKTELSSGYRGRGLISMCVTLNPGDQVYYHTHTFKGAKTNKMYRRHKAMIDVHCSDSNRVHTFSKIIDKEI